MNNLKYILYIGGYKKCLKELKTKIEISEDLGLYLKKDMYLSISLPENLTPPDFILDYIESDLLELQDYVLKIKQITVFNSEIHFYCSIR